MIPIHNNEPVSEIIEQEPLPETQESNADYLRNLGTPIDDVEKHKYIDRLAKLLIAYHNTTANPRRLEISSFTVVDVFKLKFDPPPMDKDIALPSDYSLLQFYLKRNGKAETFNVEDTFKSPSVAVFSISLAFD